jgi:DNA invertase Pin-like site-specific DNA recombinase
MRCSGDGQIDGDTWDRQQDAIARYAKLHNIEVVSEFRDEGVTGKMELEGRSGLSACIQYVSDHDIALVLVESSDRLARDMIVAEVLIREFQKLRVHVISASGGVNLTEGNDNNPTAKLIRQILGAVAEFDRCVTVLKLRGARERVKARTGRCEGPKPFGTSEGHRPTIDRILSLRASGMAVDTIAETLNAEGLKSKKGGRWHASSVRNVLLREQRKVAA